MEVTGRIIVALPEQGGTSKAGKEWKKREYVLETEETYPKKVAFNFFGERADQYPLTVGQRVKISFDIDSREYQGRWYVDCRAWKAEEPGVATPQQAAQPFGAVPQSVAQAPQQGYVAQAGIPTPPPAVDLTPAATDDLPF